LNTWTLVTPFALAACTPLGDLDATGRGAAGSAASAAASGPASSGASAGGMAGAGLGGSGATDSPRGGTSGETHFPTNTAAAGPTDAGSSSSGGASPQPGAGAASSEAGSGGASQEPDAGGADPGPFGDLPNDQAASPVQGDVSCAEASYSGESSFEVLTPTARYVLLRNRGSIISVTDELSQRRVQWVGYSDYRPRRAVGIISNQRLPGVVTTLDTDSVTARHVRLRSESAAGDWAWVWDFYATQATLTITRAADEFGFTYRGTPGGQLDDGDLLVLASGEERSVESSFSEPLPGTAAWLYFEDSTLGHSLFLIQHAPDEVSDRYDSLDGDSAALMFGGGRISRVPNRFSLGLVDSTNHATVTRRAEFVIDAVQ
jgi:hypothetical protein